jgi:hypothetical protein
MVVVRTALVEDRSIRLLVLGEAIGHRALEMECALGVGSKDQRPGGRVEGKRVVVIAVIFMVSYCGGRECWMRPTVLFAMAIEEDFFI